jgi:DNA-binding transcriptional MerR regulator
LLRQLQWWDERDAISPRQESKRRVYRVQEVVEIMVAATLRRKGLSLQKVRRVLRLLRLELRQRPRWIRDSGLCLLTDGKSAYVENSSTRILDRLKGSHFPMYVVSLSDQVKRISSATASALEKTAVAVLI